MVDMQLQALREGLRQIALVSTTSRPSRDISVLPRRELWDLTCANFLVGAAYAAEHLLTSLDGRVESVFVDVEQKKDFDLYALAGSILKKSKRVSYKPNDATAIAADELFRWSFSDDLAGLNILVYGLGNIGAKVALSLAERGADVHCLGRNFSKVQRIASALNDILPTYSRASIVAIEDLDDVEESFFDGMITFLSASRIVDGSFCRYLKPGALVADCGIDNFVPEFFPVAAARDLRCLRLDVRLGAPYSLLGASGFSDQFFENVLGRTQLNGVSFVAGGMVGNRGEVIIDQIKRPRQVIGIANGTGGVLPFAQLTTDDKEKLRIAESFVQSANEASV